MRPIAVIFLLLPLTVSALTASALTPQRFQCDGFSLEHGERRTIQVTSSFEVSAGKSLLSEISLGFQKTPETRLNLQIRALALQTGLSVAATFIEVATEPLGRVESVFFEKVYSEDGKEFRLHKSFQNLRLNLRCSAAGPIDSIH